MTETGRDALVAENASLKATNKQLLELGRRFGAIQRDGKGRAGAGVGDARAGNMVSEVEKLKAMLKSDDKVGRRCQSF